MTNNQQQQKQQQQQKYNTLRARENERTNERTICKTNFY